MDEKNIENEMELSYLEVWCLGVGYVHKATPESSL